MENADDLIENNTTKNITANALFEKITDKYHWSKFGDFKMIIDDKGYINATYLCKQGNKRLSTWNENKNSKSITNAVCLELNLDISEIKYSVQGGKIIEIRGTYMHPILMTAICAWCSDEMFVKMCMWVEEWKKYSPNNEIKYWKSVDESEFTNNNCDEKYVEEILQKVLNGKRQVKTEFGIIDLLTDTQIIEIKTFKLWKHALGQILAYGEEYPNHEKVVYLYNSPQDTNFDNIINICANNNVTLKIFEYEEEV
jgi:hypothetical protein